MNWQEILTILVPIFALMGWVYNRIEKNASERYENIEKKFEKIDQRFDRVDQRFNQVDQQLQSLDRRLTHLEGRFEERGYWESREWHRTGTEDKKQ